MTAHYAQLSDKTVREHWEKARKVNAAGRPVRISPDGPLGDAAWSRHRLSRATQALPNGYCQLALVQTCPHANSCLTCPMFVTTPEFLRSTMPRGGQPCRSSAAPRPPGTPASPR